MIPVSFETIMPLKYSLNRSVENEDILPTKDSKKMRGLVIVNPYCPNALTGTIILYFGSSMLILVAVPHLQSSIETWLTNQTSALKGLSLLNARFISLPRIGMFSDFMVYVPLVNSSAITPPLTKKAV